MIPASIAGRGNPFTRTVSAKVAIVLPAGRQVWRRHPARGFGRAHKTATNSCSAFDIATLLRPPIIRVAFGGDVRVAKLPVGRRQTGNNHSNISNRSAAAVGRTGRNACPPPKLLQFAQPDVAVADWIVVLRRWRTLFWAGFVRRPREVPCGAGSWSV